MDLSSLPHSPGVYLMRDRSGQILYIGKALDLAKRVSSYFLQRANHTLKIQALVQSISQVDYLPAASEREALILEQGLIRRLQPNFNTVWRDDKSFPFLKLTWGEDYPRMYLTRRVTRDGSRYFGPYPVVRPIRNLLRYLWKKKFFALRPCRYEFSEKKPLALEKARQCLYYHTRECPAPCVNRISKDDYRKIALEADLFFRGRYKPLLDQWQTDMKSAALRQDYERAAQLRDNLSALEQMDERVTIRKIELMDVFSHVDRSRAVTELQQALALPRPPLRIECFDISHIQGVETVASMVVFERGVPKKSDYRKFKIKTVHGIDDFASMGEVVGRRYRRLRAENLPLPDLVLIDGGKGQLSSAQTAIKASLAGLRVQVPMAALAKREEELFQPEHEEPVRLPKDSIALHLVQYVRDEAHRFAVTFHRQRRSKLLLRSASPIDRLPNG